MSNLNLQVALEEISKLAAKLKEERDEAREQIDNIRKMLSESGEAVGNGEHDYSIIDMIENLIKSKDYFVRKSDSLERERDEARQEIEGCRNKWHCAVEIAATAQVERDEARELARQMSESNQVLLADVRFYRNAWEQLKKEKP